VIQTLLPYPPSVNAIWRYSGKGRAYLTPEAKTWKAAAAWAVKGTLLKGSTAVLGPFHAYIEVGRPDKRKRDLDNLLKVCLDAAKDGGAIRDDSDAQSISARWVDDLKGVRITITPADEPWITLGDAASNVLKDIGRDA
jgi:Holliday junction resolvase RusA-like endonuclease